MLILLNALWFIFELKFILFWLYLWQLKEYHIGRFADHFRTHKGKKLLFDSAQILKLALLVFLLAGNNLFVYVFSFLTLIYFVELIIFLRSIFIKSFKKPVITVKTIFLISVSFGILIIFLVWTLQFYNELQISWLVAFDILTPLIISAVVLFFQPFFVAIRNNTLRKAKIKIKKIKDVSGLKVIAITGSYGKTSTKEFLIKILSAKFKVLATTEHQNAEIGIAKCILENLQPSHQVFIAEVAAYDKGKVKEVCNILQPKIGIVTGVNEQHLSVFGSMKNLLSGEGGGELAEVLQKDGILIVNGDNKHCLDLVRKYPSTQLRAKFYSLTNKILNSDIWADEITIHKNYISFVAVEKAGEVAHFDAKVLGKHNIQNLLGAILIAKELGMTFGEISGACKNIAEGEGGMVLKQGKHGIDIIDSSYSANPDGVFADLDYLSIYPNKKIIIMPCLIELGEKSSEIHEKIGKKIAEICDMAIITSKDKFIELEKGFKSVQDDDILRRSGKNVAKCILCDDSQEIYSAITLFCKSGDAVLLEGRVPKGLLNLLTE
ncbi:MAG: UDP-N-acetylmuramoyl-tripeptide--D-alanyl-D-alanine ligase [Candidatus Staskawiczbacteria bacterium]|nr:UDP-N-acetylmuramoyl-tripeptide--D-alanyl-D-alanine ligase [Candidatus Staskawiczbacteria bacterium]